jgi:site-specific DNA-methyltransferase (cytosine-N4-specific)
MTNERNGDAVWAGENDPETYPNDAAQERRPVTQTFGYDIRCLTQILLQPAAILCGDSRSILRSLPDNFFACCITSPPYWDTRYSGLTDKLGGEADHDDYIRTLLQIFREVRRTLVPTGTLWLVIGDTYASDNSRWSAMYRKNYPGTERQMPFIPEGFKPKDLMGIPWRLAMALQNDGWYLRSDIIWSIPNRRPEPVLDRPSRTHDYVFLLSKAEEYTYYSRGQESVWEIPTILRPLIDYAVFPEALVERCMRASSLKDDVVLDPFFGSGTVGVVARRLKRKCVGIELSPDYAKLAEKRIREG